MTNANETTATREYEMNATIPATVIEDGIAYHLRCEPWTALASLCDPKRGPVRIAVYSRTVNRRSMFE